MTRVPNSPNAPQDTREHCDSCCDIGVVPVGTELRATKHGGTYHEEVWGPCPMCEVGQDVEFPKKGRWPWGPSGFWQGKPLDYEKECRCNVRPATPEQARAGLQSLRLSMGSLPTVDEVLTAPVAVPPTPGPEPPPKAPTGARETLGDAPKPVSEPDHHRCPNLNTRDVPWKQSTCEFCGKPEEEITL